MGKKKKNKANLQEMLGRVEKEEKQLHQPKSDDKNANVKTEISEEIENDKYIKQDIFKIAYGLIACFIVLGIVWFVDAKTDTINDFSQSLANILRIGK